jgi:phosphopantetheinyl transferase
VPAEPSSVDVRVVDLLADGEVLLRAEALLSPAERARAVRGVPAVRRRRVLLRAALRTAIADELGTDAVSVPLATSPAGRPHVPGPDGQELLHVSCSASGGVGVVVVSRGRRVGVDVQQVEPWQPAVLAEGWLTGAEQAALAELPAAARAQAVTRAWTQKEAVLKGRGTGLTGPPAEPETVIGRAEGRLAGWTLSDVPVPPGWVASLALEQGPDEMPSARETPDEETS